MSRMPLVVLVASAVLGLLTGVTVVVVAMGGDQPRRPAFASERAVETVAVQVLRAWDRRRERAFARGDRDALAALYVDGSRTGAADLGVLQGYRDRGLRVTGLHTRLLAAELLDRTDGRLTIQVTDVLTGGVATAGEQRWALPRDQPSSRRVELVRVSGEWRVEEAYVVD